MDCTVGYMLRQRRAFKCNVFFAATKDFSLSRLTSMP